MTAPAILNFKPVDKNTLRAVFDIQLPSGLIICGAMLHVKNDRGWTPMAEMYFQKPTRST